MEVYNLEILSSFFFNLTYRNFLYMQPGCIVSIYKKLSLGRIR